MSRRRYLSTDVSRDAALNRLAIEQGDFVVLFYTWMIPHAGDDGTIRGTAEEIMYEVLPGRRDKETQDVEAALLLLHDEGLIDWDADARCLSFPESAFYRIQSYIREERRRTPKSSPAPSEEKDERKSTQSSDGQRKSAHSAANQRKSAQISASFNPSFSPSFRDTEKKDSGGTTKRAREETAAAMSVLDLGDEAGAVDLVKEATRQFPDLRHSYEARKCREHYRDWERLDGKARAERYVKWLEKAQLFQAADAVKFAPPRASPSSNDELPWLPDDPDDEARVRKWDEDLKAQAKTRGSKHG